MLDRFIRFCDAWTRISNISWFKVPNGLFDGLMAAIAIAMFWVEDPLIALAAGSLLTGIAFLAVRTYPYRLAFSATMCSALALIWWLSTQ